MRTIDADELKGLFPDSGEGAWTYNVTAKLYIDAQPTIESERKTGRWRHYEGCLTCSECGIEYYDDIMEYCGDDVPRFCPNCGADMREDGEADG